MNDHRPGPFLVLTGPTGVGKTSLSVGLARLLNAEVVSLDSRQVYRELTIGTDKPTVAERELAPHHFIDELALRSGASWSAGRFAETANERIRAILSRGRVPLIVGGSTLYLQALVHGLAQVPAGDPAVRSDLSEAISKPGGAESLYNELRQVDPEGAGRIDPTKTQRLIRALEVYQTTGKTWSSFLNQSTSPPYRYTVVVLFREREALYQRIEARVEAMLEAGLVGENRGLQTAGHRLDTNPLKTIGYQEPQAYLEGRFDYAEMVRQLKRNSRRYAKRQLTWFRRFDEYVWLDAVSVTMGEVMNLIQ